MSCLNAWIFDVYPAPAGVTIWLIDRDGVKHRCSTDFSPSFFLQLNEREAKRVEALARRCSVPLKLQCTQRRELFSGDWRDVTQIFVQDATRFREAVAYFEKILPPFSFYNSNVLPAQLFLYETNLFVLAFGEYEISDEGKLINWTLHDSREAVEYSVPPLSVMTMKNAFDFVPPKYQRNIQLELSYEGQTFTLEQEDPADVLQTLNWHLHRYDPDILLTEQGDATLLPKITAMAQRYKIPMLLNRDTARGYTVTKESSFFQYNKVVHKDGAFELAGRWHVDADNSFTYTEAQMDGLFELMRLTQMTAQRQARASIGTGLSSLQLAWAYRNKVLIPSKKREPEEFKSAATLLLSDRGGLIFQPPVGYYENIAELDFVSMYPSIMVNHNVSPETVNCHCCDNHRVPELEYSLCERREGIVPSTLRAVVEKRIYYKRKRAEFKGKNEVQYRKYDSRQNALKWMLVCCFGYLGYKNARFGKIEAHESVNAFSRDAILTAKEVAERNGYQLVHGIIDCIWLKKQGAAERDYLKLCREITAQVGVDISLEGIYDWICFPASKMAPALPTANRYFGWYKHGEFKIRGIEARRHDTPAFLKKMQVAMLDRMSKCRTVEELQASVPDLLEIVRSYVSMLKSGRASPMELVLHRRISQEAEEYANNSISAVVTKMIEDAGIHLAAGESIDFIIIDQSGKKKPEKAKPIGLYAFEDGYDIEKYTELTLKTAETVMLPFGWDYDALKSLFVPDPPKEKKRGSKKKFLRSLAVIGQIELR